MLQIMNRAQMYLWILTYMVLTLPIGLTLHFYDVDRIDIPIMYGSVAIAKVLVCLYFLRTFNLNQAQILLIVCAALTLRLALNAPWMPFLIGGVIFLSSSPKKVW